MIERSRVDRADETILALACRSATGIGPFARPEGHLTPVPRIRSGHRLAPTAERVWFEGPV